MTRRSSMKRVCGIVIVLLLLVLGGSTLFADSRLGLEFGNPTWVVIWRPAPLDFRLGYDFTGLLSETTGNFFFLSADIRAIDSYRLVDFVHFFLGVGVYTKVTTGAQVDFELGARIPVGLQTFLFSGQLELFVEIAPTVALLPTLSALGDYQGWFGITIPLPRL
jgi:hypothetical protein